MTIYLFVVYSIILFWLVAPSLPSKATAEALEPVVQVAEDVSNSAVTEATEQPSEPAAPVLKLVPSIPLNELSTEQLRGKCADAGIKWRNVRGKKHLSKPEMVRLLSQRQAA